MIMRGEDRRHRAGAEPQHEDRHDRDLGNRREADQQRDRPRRRRASTSRSSMPIRTPDDDAEHEADQGGVERLDGMRPAAPARARTASMTIWLGRGRTTSLTPKTRQATSHTHEEADDERGGSEFAPSREFMRASMGAARHVVAARLDDQRRAARCVSVDETGLVGHVHRARPRERHHAVVDDAAGTRAASRRCGWRDRPPPAGRG